MTIPRPDALMPTRRMRMILARCYRGQNEVAVLGRALEMLANADGHLKPDGTVKTGVGGRPAARRPS